MTYPKQLFRAGGPYGKGERTYRVCGCADAGEEQALKAAGWHETKESAWGLEEIDETSPPTREELEQMCDSLGIAHNKRMKDETLESKIDEATRPEAVS